MSFIRYANPTGPATISTNITKEITITKAIIRR